MVKSIRKGIEPIATPFREEAYHAMPIHTCCLLLLPERDVAIGREMRACLVLERSNSAMGCNSKVGGEVDYRGRVCHRKTEHEAKTGQARNESRRGFVLKMATVGQVELDAPRIHTRQVKPWKYYLDEGRVGVQGSQPSANHQSEGSGV